ncbi:MAG: hypothetical protein HY290_06825 [Planctomycetia bacterium]|nr:hypothetical protein [Planctomycetia bacterium]
MPNSYSPVPLGSSRDNAWEWIDPGTMCRQLSPLPGPIPTRDELEEVIAIELDNAGTTAPAKTAAKAPTTKELNIAGEFPWDPAITDAEEIAEFTAGRWSPSTDDFTTVPGGTVAVAPSFGNLLGAILQEADGSISRVNLFTHANKSMVSFHGHIEKKSIGSADVFLDVNSPGDNMTAMDTTSMTNLNQPGVTFTAPKAIKGKKNFTVADVTKKFAADAVFVLYACHSGQDAAFLKSIAQFFQVKVIGFKPVVAYFPPAQSGSKFQRSGEKIGLGVGGSPVTDWRKLITDSQAITASP